ncbi:MAG: hypothetical protein JO328_06985 [Hyphomicrobiales bacterium]|nr:hypothetical protein [Hyphomicrobiales bacterium]MBV9426262.1 hypothetical protein [Bradyrhizobiaceae bacterium]
MQDRINESDWRIFKPLREKALERFCERVLDEVVRIRAETGKTQHERYIEIYRMMKERDIELERVFDYLRRSTALMQLVGFRSLGLVTDEEYSRFSAPTRETVDDLLKPLPS